MVRRMRGGGLYGGLWSSGRGGGRGCTSPPAPPPHTTTTTIPAPLRKHGGDSSEPQVMLQVIVRWWCPRKATTAAQAATNAEEWSGRWDTVETRWLRRVGTAAATEEGKDEAAIRRGPETQGYTSPPPSTHTHTPLSPSPSSSPSLNISPLHLLPPPSPLSRTAMSATAAVQYRCLRVELHRAAERRRVHDRSVCVGGGGA